MIKAINRSIAARHEEDEKGFTLIELLVVILIIGVLAAIAIPAFLNQREGAWKTQVTSDITNASIAAETYGADHNGNFSGITATGVMPTNKDTKTTLVGNGFRPTGTLTDGVTIVFTPATSGTSYTILGTHANLGTKTWTYDSTTGKTTEG